jgi:phage recombination protein Bet
VTTTTDVAVRSSSAPAQAAPAALAIQPGQTTFDDYQNAALNQLGLREAGNGDRAVFLHVSQRTGLDPFAKQIYMIGRPEKQPDGSWGKKWTIQTGIDGWRVVRTRAERLAGVRGILGRSVFYDADGGEHKVWVSAGPPAACEITYTVRDGNGDTPYTSVLRYDDYVQVKDGKPVAQWASKPTHMLEKCTEADVYRKAFPQDFSGIVLEDAMPPAKDWDSMTDAELDAEYERVTRRRGVSDDQVRQRRQTVATTVVTPEPSPAGTETTPAPSPSAPPADVPPAGEAKSAAEYLADKLAGLNVRDEAGQAAKCALILGRTLRPLEDLSAADATDVMRYLRNCKTAADLDALLAELAMQGDPRGEAGE